MRAIRNRNKRTRAIIIIIATTITTIIIKGIEREGKGKKKPSKLRTTNTPTTKTRQQKKTKQTNPEVKGSPEPAICRRSAAQRARKSPRRCLLPPHVNFSSAIFPFSSLPRPPLSSPGPSPDVSPFSPPPPRPSVPSARSPSRSHSRLQQ